MSRAPKHATQACLNNLIRTEIVGLVSRFVAYTLKNQVKSSFVGLCDQESLTSTELFYFTKACLWWKRVFQIFFFQKSLKIINVSM